MSKYSQNGARVVPRRAKRNKGEYAKSAIRYRKNQGFGQVGQAILELSWIKNASASELTSRSSSNAILERFGNEKGAKMEGQRRPKLSQNCSKRNEQITLHLKAIFNTIVAGFN